MLKKIKENFALLLIVPYAVGLIGILLPVSRDFFLNLTPLMLWYSFFLAVVEEWHWVSKKLIFIVLGGAIAFGAEYLGVNYGYLFGDYTYGTTLGYKFMAVPVLIGINWMMLTISARSFSGKLLNKFWVSALLAALIVTVFDFLLEPVAIRFGWWWWSDGDIPLFNYLTWFGVAFILQLLLGKVQVGKGRSFWIIIIQSIFFAVLLLL
jgi:putative membrane protein